MEPHTHSSRLYGALASGVLGIAALTILGRLVLGELWSNYTLAHSYVMGTVLVVVWSGTAVILQLRHVHRGLAMAAWVLSFVAPLSLLAHSFVGRVGGGTYDSLYLVGAALCAFFLKRMWDGLELRRTRGEVQHVRHEPPRLRRDVPQDRPRAHGARPRSA